MKRKRTLNKGLNWSIKVLLVVVSIIGIGFVVINTNSFKHVFIPTALSTMSHKYLAYLLYSQETIDEVMLENYVEEVNEEVRLDDVVPRLIKSKEKYFSKYEREVYTKDKGNDIYKIIRIKESKFRGYLTVIYDPSDVSLAVSSRLGEKGESVNTMCKNNEALVCINGGGFSDLEGFGNGARPLGVIIKDRKVIWNSDSYHSGFIGFTTDNKLYFSNKSSEAVIKNGMRDAIQFGPKLIVNGRASKIHGDGGLGIAPRTAIGQRKDGIVLFLVIEGRLPGYSVGATIEDVTRILLKYGAYNAANLDGGASSTMSLNGKLLNTPSAGAKYGGRMVSNAWIVTNKSDKVVETIEK